MSRRVPIRRGFAQIGFFGVLMLVLLRMTIGWHFLYAGIWKLEQPDFSSAAFLGQAKGPFADKFHELSYDFGGLERLKPYLDDVLRMRGEAVEEAVKTEDAFDSYIKRVDSRYKLTDAQKTQANNLADYHRDQVTEYLADSEHAGDMADYEHEWARLADMKRAKDRDTPYNQKRIWDKQTELLDQSNGWLADIAAIHERFEAGVHDLLTDEQRKKGPLIEPVTKSFDMDKFIIWTNIAIGGCLLVGLFTRLAALGGGLFLLLIVLAQPDWPGLYPPPPPAVGRSFIVTKEFVEMMATFTLMALPVGRWGGLDFFIHHLFVRPIFGGKART